MTEQQHPITLAGSEPDPEEVKKWLITNCVFSGMPPAPYRAWNEWAEAAVSAKVIQGLYIKARDLPDKNEKSTKELAVEESQSFYNQLWELLETELGDTVLCDQMADRIYDLVLMSLPKEQFANSQNTHVECAIEGYNDCLNEIKSKLR